MKVRNKKDSPTKEEFEILKDYHLLDLEGKEIKPKISQLESGNYAFFAPIRVNEFCLNCHGKIGETLTDENHKIIKNNKVFTSL